MVCTFQILVIYTWVEGLVSEHNAGTYTMVYHYKGTCICSLINRSTLVQVSHLTNKYCAKTNVIYSNRTTISSKS